MAGCCAFIGIDSHKQLADEDELRDVVMLVGDELLDSFVGADVSEVAENRHEALAPEWEGFNFYTAKVVWGIADALVVDAIREEASDDGE